VRKQAQSRHCFVCGIDNPFGLKMKFYTISPGIVETHYTAGEHHQGYPGIVHGGIIASMLDEVMGRVFMGDENPRFMVTGELKIKYRKPVPLGQVLTLRGEAVKDNGRVAKAIGTISGPDGTLLVEGEILVVNIPQHLIPPMDNQTLGWQVYPDQEVEG
jgi:acyl-coenzyme A thioesterase PaaI-like protein